MHKTSFWSNLIILLKFFNFLKEQGIIRVEHGHFSTCFHCSWLLFVQLIDFKCFDIEERFLVCFCIRALLIRKWINWRLIFILRNYPCPSFIHKLHKCFGLIKAFNIIYLFHLFHFLYFLRSWSRLSLWGRRVFNCYLV